MADRIPPRVARPSPPPPPPPDGVTAEQWIRAQAAGLAIRRTPQMPLSLLWPDAEALAYWITAGSRP